jgi:eukaryotic-like serine/threonine-protein kinase
MSEDSETRVPAGRYRLITPLGKRVMRGWDTHLRQVVAVRLFPPPDDSDQVVERARVLADLSHPGLVRVLDAGSEDGEPFVVSEFIAGTTLKARLADGPLPAATVGQLGVMLAKALAYAHSHGVLHRDVAPGSIMLGPGGEPCLTDVGIAETPTASYMAPEQVGGAEPGAAADVYALGLVLLESLTGRTEYPGDDAASKRVRLTHPPRIEPGTPFASALEAMTRTDPAERPDAAACVDLLRGSSAKSRVQTRTVLFAAVAAAVVATGVALALNAPRQPQPEPREASVVEPKSTVTVRVTSGTPTVVEGTPVVSEQPPPVTPEPPQPPPGNPVQEQQQGQPVGYTPPSAPTLTPSAPPPPPRWPTVTATISKKPKPSHPKDDDKGDD